MEGVTGVTAMPQVTPNDPEYPQAREWFMAELLALIEGLRTGGAEDISIFDEHWFGRNIDLARIPKGIRVYYGKPPYLDDDAQGVDKDTDALILQGFHSMESSGYTLAHTYEPDFRAIYINGHHVGEIGVEAAIAGDLGVPLGLIIGDSAGNAEARKLIPDVATVDSKKSSKVFFAAECYPLVEVTEVIRNSAIKLVKRPAQSTPLKFTGPVELKCVFKETPYLKALHKLAPDNFASDDTFILNADTVLSAWARYWQLKLKAQTTFK